MRRLLCIVVLCLTFSTVGEEPDVLRLQNLDADDGVRESGARLVGLPFDLHALEDSERDAVELVVGVHGWRSQGYEWVYPLQTINSDARHMYFFNWDTGSDRCQTEVVADLHSAIKAELTNQPSFTSVSVVGHSLGGIVVAQLADGWDADVPLTIHAVAAPLAYLRANDDATCVVELPKNQQANVRFIQWRTQFELDNAFNRLDFNPMVVDIPNSIVVDLPSTYRDRRLGHNWSISYVSEQIANATPD